MAETYESIERERNQLRAEVEALRKDAARLLDKSKALWGIIDDIDTYIDVYKPDLEAYERAIIRKVKERHSHLSTDGYELFDQAIT